MVFNIVGFLFVTGNRLSCTRVFWRMKKIYLTYLDQKLLPAHWNHHSCRNINNDTPEAQATLFLFDLAHTIADKSKASNLVQRNVSCAAGEIEVNSKIQLMQYAWRTAEWAHIIFISKRVTMVMLAVNRVRDESVNVVRSAARNASFLM